MVSNPSPPSLPLPRGVTPTTNNALLYLRPGAAEVLTKEEIARVVPIVEGIREAAAAKGEAVSISVDTRRAAVAEAAVAAGAHAVNDVSGGQFDPEMLSVVARAEVPLIMMHMRYVITAANKLISYWCVFLSEVLSTDDGVVPYLRVTGFLIHPIN